MRENLNIKNSFKFVKKCRCECDLKKNIIYDKKYHSEDERLVKWSLGKTVFDNKWRQISQHIIYVTLYNLLIYMLKMFSILYMLI